jgi:hypothetical protein
MTHGLAPLEALFRLYVQLNDGFIGILTLYLSVVLERRCKRVSQTQWCANGDSRTSELGSYTVFPPFRSFTDERRFTLDSGEVS